MTGPSVDAVNIQIGAQVAPLVESMGAAATSVETATRRMDTAFRRTASNVRGSVEAVEQAGDGLTRRFEHVGISVSFAATALAEGSERGLTRAAHAVAALGFAFGPIAGAAATAGAIIIEQFVSAASKAEDQAKATRERVEDMYRAIGEGGSGPSAAKRAVQLYSGDKFIPRDDPFATEIRGGGIQGLQRQIAPLQAKLDAVTSRIAALGSAGSAGFDIEAFEKLQAEAGKYAAALAPLNERLQALEDAHKNILALANQFTAIQVEQNDANANIAQSKTNEKLALGQADWIRNGHDAAVKAMNKIIDATDKVRENAQKRSLDRQKAAEDHFYEDQGHQAVIDAEKKRKIEEATDEERRKREQQWATFFSATFESAVNHWIQTGENLRAFWRELWYDIVQATLTAYVRMEAAAAAHALAIRGITLSSATHTIAVKTWEAIRWIAIEAAKAGAAAWSALAGIPIIGPALGVAAAAVTVAGVLALAKGLGSGSAPTVGGGSVGASAPAVSQATGARRGGGDVYHIHAIDAASFRTFAMKNRSAFVDAVGKAARDNGIPARKLGVG